MTRQLESGGAMHIAASVATGMEEIAACEVRSKILKNSDQQAVITKQGRIYFTINKDFLPNIHSLRSVDRLFMVIHSVENYIYPESKEAAMLNLKNMAQEIDWSNVAKFWNYNLPYLKDKFKQEDLGRKPPPPKKRKTTDNLTADDDLYDSEDVSISCYKSNVCENKTSLLPEDEKGNIRFRVTTNRVGKKQPITSPEASYRFGGEIQNITQWKLCKIQPGDVVVDPMCGSGSIPIEGALEWPENFYMAGDNVNAAVTRCRSNVEFLDKNPTFAMKYIDKVPRKRLPLDTIKWDVRHLPLKTNSADVIISDLPFGKRIGTKVDNRKLYPALLKEMARVARTETGRACLLTQDKRTIIRTVDSLRELWSLKRTLYINIGGLTAGLFLLNRTKTAFQTIADNNPMNSNLVVSLLWNDMDANIIELRISEGHSAKVCLFGATVTSWINEGKEQLFLSSLSKMDGTKAVRGGIPIVFPNFGPWTAGPQHGFARISWWKLVGNEKIEGVAKAVFALEDNEKTLAMWNHKFKLLYEVELRPGVLKTSLTVTNSGNTDIDFTTLLHTYLRVHNVEECAISGFEGCSYIDKVKQESDNIESRQEVVISENVDSVYRGTKKHIVKCRGGRTMQIDKVNFPDTVLWNPWSAKAKEMSDFDDEGYKSMICVEPGYVTRRKVLPPGQTFTCSQTLSTI